MGDQHARFAPSAAPRWMRCPVSVPRSEAVFAQQGEPPEGEAAKWGTESHEMLSKGIEWGLPPTALAGSDQENREKAECADVAYNYAVTAQQQMMPCALHSEWRVDPGQGTEVEGFASGTADIVLANNQMLEVDDFKTGRGIVEPDSYQLQLYLLGALKLYWPDRSQPPPFSQFRTGIIQPRAPHKAGSIRHRGFTLVELLETESQMLAAIQTADDPLSHGIPGEEQCRYCPAKGSCQEHAQWLLGTTTQGTEAAQAESIEEAIGTSITLNIPGQLNPDQLSEILRLAPSVEAWIDSVREEVKRRLEQRQDVPGWKLGRAQSRPKWLHDAAVVAKKLRNIKGVMKKHYMVDKLRTPLQVMSAIPGETAASVEKLWERPQGAVIIVPDTDPRPDPMAWMDTINKPEQE